MKRKATSGWDGGLRRRGRRAWPPAVMGLLALAGAGGRCDQAGPSPSERGSPTTATAPSETQEAEAGGPTEVWARHYVVMLGSQRIGQAELSRHTFQKGEILRTSFERRLFPATDLQGLDHASHSLLRCSESAMLGKISFWGAGMYRTQGWSFKMKKAAAGRVSLAGSLLGREVSASLQPPGDYDLAYRRYVTLQRICKGEKTDKPAAYCLDWYSQPAAFHPLDWTKEAPEDVTTADGRTIKTYRFVVGSESFPTQRVVWVDEEGIPVRVRVPGLEAELILADGATAKDTSREMSWSQAKAKYNLPEKISRELEAKVVAVPKNPTSGDETARLLHFMLFDPFFGH